MFIKWRKKRKPGDDGAKGGGSIAYTQKGGTVNGVSADNNAVVWDMMTEPTKIVRILI
jgi:hypothetical protein